jgi:AraC-like DNA-binding protein
METVASYREFAPCEALRAYVRAFFCFTTQPGPRESRGRRGRRVIRETLFREGQPFWSRLFAEGQVSMVFSIGAGYRIEGLWQPRPGGAGGHVIGAMASAHAATHGESLVQAGVYFRAAGSHLFTGVPASELAGRVVALSDLWGRECDTMEDRILQASGAEPDATDCLERALLARRGQARILESLLDIPGLAAFINARQGAVSVRELALEAGVSRQYLTRVFREGTGVTPKLYARLARFRAVLSHADGGGKADWARIAAETGYADQSHMIADFRQFSGVTPEKLTAERSFHPFIACASASRMNDAV